VKLLRKSISEGASNWYGRPLPLGFGGYKSYWFKIHKDIAFEPMRGCPPFEELMNPKG